MVSVFFFLLPPQSVNRYTLVCFSLYIIYLSRHLDAVLISLSSVRADPAYEAIHYAGEIAIQDISYKRLGKMDPSVLATTQGC